MVVRPRSCRVILGVSVNNLSVAPWGLGLSHVAWRAALCTLDDNADSLAKNRPASCSREESTNPTDLGGHSWA